MWKGIHKIIIWLNLNHQAVSEILGIAHIGMKYFGNGY